MVSFKLALAAWVAPIAAAAVPPPTEHRGNLKATSAHRSLQGDFEVNTPIACYQSTTGTTSSCLDSTTPTATAVNLPGTTDDGTLVVVFPHDPVVSGGERKITYYTGGCTAALTDDEEASFGAEPSVATNPGGFFAPTAPETAVTQYTMFKFPLATLSALPAAVSAVSTTGGATTYDIDFCIRLGLFSSTGEELGFREIDLDVIFSANDQASLDFQASATTVTTDAFDFGVYSILAGICSDSPSSAPITNGEQVAICLVPQRTPTGTGAATADTNEIKINSIEDFVFFIDEPTADDLPNEGEVQQQAFENGEVANSDTSLSPSRGVACGAGLGRPGDEDIHGCKFLTTLKTEFFDNPPTVTSGSVTVSGLGTVEIEYQGRRRKLQLAVGAKTDKPASTKISTEIIRRDSDDAAVGGFCDFSDSGFWRWLSFITRPLCNFIVRFIFGPLFGVQA